MNEKDLIQEVIKELCHRQQHYLFDWPKRENIAKYHKELDIAQNEDFALWEMQMTIVES